MTADADNDGDSVVLICDGTNWQAVSSGVSSGIGGSATMTAGTMTIDSPDDFRGYISAAYATSVGVPSLETGTLSEPVYVNGASVEMIGDLDGSPYNALVVLTPTPSSTAGAEIEIDNSTYPLTFAESLGGYTIYIGASTAGFVDGNTYTLDWYTEGYLGSFGHGAPIIDQYAAAGMPIDPVLIPATDNKWPDFIFCDVSSNPLVAFLIGYSPAAADDGVLYELGGAYGYEFDASGAATSLNGFDTDCGASDSDIATICSEGRCGFFGGNGSGGGGGTTPAGSNGEVQFNSGGNSLGASDNLFWDSVNNRLGLNTDTPAATLAVVGDIHYTGVLQDVSDKRLKENITPLGSALDRVLALNGYSFTMKNDKSGAVEYGLLAQEVEKVFPELVRTERRGLIIDRDGYKTMNYVGMIAPLVEAVKAQQAQIEALEKRIEALEK